MDKVLINDKAVQVKNWKVKSFAEIFNVRSSKRVMKSDWKEDGVPFYRAREVVKLSRDGFVDNDLFISEELFEKFTKDDGYIKKGDLIVSAVGTLGSCYIVRENDRFYFKDASVLWLEKKDETVDSKFIFYGFKSDFLINQIKNNSPGATVGTLTITKARQLKIPIPPSLSEQQRIVSKLDALFAEIDASLALIDQNIAQAEALKLSVLDEEIHDEAFETVPYLKYITERKERLKPEPQTVYNIIGLENIESYSGRLINFKPLKGEESISNKSVFKEGDVLYSKLRPYLNKVIIAEFDGIATTEILPFIPDSERFLNTFIAYFLRSETIVQKINISCSGARMPRVIASFWKTIEIPMPSLESQQKIVQKLDTVFTEIDALVLDYTKKRDNLEALKSSLLDQAFKGEL